MSSTASSFTFADLFAGIGGFAAALRAFGGMPVYSVEVDEAAARVYELNWGHSPLGDITADANDGVMNVPAHDILAAGFPCQPFSKSGAQKGMEEIRGTLFFDIMAIVRAKLPAVVLLENVRNLAGPRHEHEWAVIIDHLRNAGYRVSETPAVLSPVNLAPEVGGHPQTRDRVFIAATRVAPTSPTPEIAEQLRKGTLVLPDPTKDTNETAPPISLDHLKMTRPWDLVADLPLDTKNDQGDGSVSAEEWRWIDHWGLLVQRMRDMLAHEAEREERPAKEIPGFPIWANVWTPDMTEQEKLLADAAGMKWKIGHLTKNFNLYKRLRDFDAYVASSTGVVGEKTWTALWLHKTLTFPESRQKMEWQAQDTGTIRECVISMRPSGLRVKQMTHLPALVAISQTPILAPLNRRLTIEEGTLLQGLPTTFAGASWKQLGNGVNAGVVAQALLAQVNRDDTLLGYDERGNIVLEAVRRAMKDTGGDLRGRIAEAVERGQALARANREGSAPRP